MLLLFIICFLLISGLLADFKRRLDQGDRRAAGKCLAVALVVTVAGIVAAQFV